ncbi:hypothetical protein L9G16_10635 [Shewanella sp. A25]|nr:hypothetical protein [Shewanella shenzhenensis]
MQVNIQQTSLTQAVASNRQNAIQSLGTTSATQAVAGQGIEEASREKSNQVIELAEDPSANLQDRLGAHLEYEQQTQANQGAIARYLQTQHAAKREEIQQMVGVDLYA